MNELFRIFKIDERELENTSVNFEEPQSQGYEELLLGIKGEIEHFIDFKTSNIEAPFVSFITKGKVHRVIPKKKEEKCEIWRVQFKSEFIPESTFQLYSMYHGKANVKLNNGTCFNRLVALCEMMEEEAKQENPSYAIIKQLLSLLFTIIEHEKKKLDKSRVELQKSQNIAFGNFLNILEENFQKPLSVDFYADKLFMSTRNLNLICQEILEQSVSEIIDTRKLIEAKNLLISTDKNITEIANDLGYNENSYFSNVFKKKSGQSPTEFRNEMKKLLTT
ncbi:AraC family transcriptional regulator [Brumimicrobium salinarum]|uniref:AraC family transcriptional regulator n=1 Tax=Brumimicrobium salinarum TaxID=2058658 RepID=A0A2I0R1I6_9FLAO|nr:AraC family transcriptional regulator [Brumimicrobium salinarum]PKR80444.1 AraC family transcriptional regulator [Brumimicrobium salinarum]